MVKMTKNSAIGGLMEPIQNSAVLKSELTANVLSVDNADVCLRSKFKNKSWLLLHKYVFNPLQLFSCCFYIFPKAKSTEK